MQAQDRRQQDKGRDEEAEQWLQECVALYRETGVLEELGWALGDLAVAARGLGDLCQAR